MTNETLTALNKATPTCWSAKRAGTTILISASMISRTHTDADDHRDLIFLITSAGAVEVLVTEDEFSDFLSNRWSMGQVERYVADYRNAKREIELAAA